MAFTKMKPTGFAADSVLNGDDSDYSREKPRKFAAWKMTVFYGIGVATFVLLTNFVVLIWATTTLPLNDGIATAHTGSCKRSRKLTIWLDLAKNVLSTLLLAASNNCAQILSSPTRTDITRAHSHMKWLDIGVPSIRNLGTIPIWRSCLWALLFASSIPLHLMYNSAIFSSRQSHNYNAFAVTEDFQNVDVSLDGEWIDESVLQTATAMQRNLSSLIRMNNAECLRTYTQSQYLTDWHNLLIVTNAKLPPGYGIANTYWGNWTTTIGPPKWPCTGSVAILEAIEITSNQYELATQLGVLPMFGLVNDTLKAAVEASNEILRLNIGNQSGTIAFSRCELPTLINNGASWTLALGDHYNTTGTLKTAEVQYCLAEPAKESCSILINTTLLWIVIVCNAIKILCLGITTCTSNFAPLVNIGDAIESFLNHPEKDTCRLGPISASDVRKGRLASRNHVEDARKSRQGRSRANVASPARWAFCIIICTVLIAIGTRVVVTDRSGVWTFGTFDPKILVQFSLGLSITTNVILANVPQLAISFAYIFYNNIFTCMAMAGEFASYATMRKSLRVSRPKGMQRSTWWLSLPYRYSIPMLAASALLHWFIARSLYFVKIDVTDPNGNLITVAGNLENGDHTSGYTGCAFSPSAALIALVIWIIFLAMLIRYSMRRLHPGIPVAGSCSRALSAASHCPRTDLNASILTLQYGIYTEEEEGILYEKVGFSSEEVLPHDKVLAYYQYYSPRPTKVKTAIDKINDWLLGPEEPSAPQMLPASDVQRNCHLNGSAVDAGKSDECELLDVQYPQAYTGMTGRARAELKEELRRINGPYDMSWRASSVVAQEEAGPLPGSRTQGRQRASWVQRYEQRGALDDKIVRSDEVALLGIQPRQTHAERYARAERGVEEGLRARDELYDVSRQASSVQLTDEIELLPISPAP